MLTVTEAEVAALEAMALDAAALDFELEDVAVVLEEAPALETAAALEAEDAADEDVAEDANDELALAVEEDRLDAPALEDEAAGAVLPVPELPPPPPPPQAESAMKRMPASQAETDFLGNLRMLSHLHIY